MTGMWYYITVHKEERNKIRGILAVLVETGAKDVLHRSFPGGYAVSGKRISRILILAGMVVLAGSRGLVAAQEGPSVISKEHVVVYGEAGRFAGWPANNGLWNWGNEILVGFELGWWMDRGPNKHSIDPSRRSERVLARSLDGGQSWTLEKNEVLDSDLTVSPRPSEGVNFAHPQLAIQCTSERFYLSYDRGKTWQNPYELPYFGRDLMARTDYIVNGPDDCFFFLTAEKSNGDEGIPFCTRTTDGGKSFDFLSWIGTEPEGYSIMPASVRCCDGKLIVAVRRYERGDIRRGWIEVYESNDDGLTFDFVCVAADTGSNGGNPPSMLMLSDTRICLAYGFRSPPYGIRAKVSGDAGRTWSDEIVLRDDGRNWDLGYTRTVQRPDGKIVTVYYFSTDEITEQFIAATIWEIESLFNKGDVNRDGVVNFQDYSTVIGQWLGHDASAEE